jgi:hypothetical protein
MKCPMYSLDKAKKIVNNKGWFIRPIHEKYGRSLYAFRVIDGVLYDSKNTEEDESIWDGWKFIVEN